MGIDGGTATTGVLVTEVVTDCVAGFLARDAGVFLAVFGVAEVSSLVAPSASSAATFLVRLGFSTTGSRFKPFSSA